MRRVGSLDGVTLAVLAICVAIEAVLTFADWGLLGLPRLRVLAYAFGGFWPGLLVDWQPNFPAQPALMFLTYGFLHGGPIHLVVNMVTLVSLGTAVTDRAGRLRYLLIYIASIVGGAVAFGLLASTLRPMVGASGALFGLAGALAMWDALDRRAQGATLGPVVRLVGLLAVLNLVLWWAMDGQLAWETHLGGFLAGAVAAFLLGRRNGHASLLS